MTTHSPIDTLIDLAVKESDLAAKNLGIAIRTVDEAESKLTLLLDYRADYAARFQANQAAGITPMGYRNFQAFLDKLDNAVTGQREVIAHAQKMVEVERLRWQACERKRMSYGTLVTRAQNEEHQRAAKREQKATDEHATRQGYYKQ